MGTNHNRMKTRFYLCLLAVLSLAGSLFSYEVRVGAETVLPGNSVEVPVLLDNAADVSTIQLQVNYDPQLLTLVSITNAGDTLGAAYTLDYEDDDGALVVILYRADSLLSGSGELVSIEFAANLGAELDMESALLLAEVELSNQDGKDLSWVFPVAATHGVVRMNFSGREDSDGDGIPDQWESRYGENTTNMVASIDSDGDGLSNFQEYIAGLNPTNFDGFGISEYEGAPQPVIYWDSVSGRVYNVYWASNLIDGFTLLSNVNWSVGCFTDLIHNVDGQGFYKIDVSLEPVD